METVQHEESSLREDLSGEGAMTIPAAAAWSGLGRSTLYALAQDGRLTFTKVGRRRLVMTASLRRLLNEGVEGE